MKNQSSFGTALKNHLKYHTFYFQSEPIQISARSRAIIERIEQFVAGVVNDLQNGQRIQITVQNRTDWTNCIVENERQVLTNTISFRSD